MENSSSSIWGGRFSEKNNDLMINFNESISFDWVFYKYDIELNKAHSKMLNKIKIISDSELKQILNGLDELKSEIESGKVQFSKELEDIHMNIEHFLTLKIGDVAKKMHTAKSRNEQVATDFRLYCREHVDILSSKLKAIIHTFEHLSKEHIDTKMIGYTHLQQAQPITFGYYLLTYIEMFKRDLERLSEARVRINLSPMGSGAIAGSTLFIDREFVAKELGFAGICKIEMDAISDRDFAIELASAMSIIMMHISRLCEDLVFYASNECNYIQFSDKYSTGSSLMPNKKNPDAIELARGKTGRVYGNLISLLTIMKGLPLAYNKDMQEDKERIFDSFQTVFVVLDVLNGAISTMKINKEYMALSVKNSYVLSTAIADYLVKKNVAFRDAHHIVGELVQYAVNNKKFFYQLSFEEFRRFSDKFDKDIFHFLEG